MKVNDTKFKEIKNLMKKYFTETKFTDIDVKDGSKIQIEEDEIATGVAVTVLDENGNSTPAPDGSVELADGRTIVIKGGLVDSISEAPAADAAGDSPEDPANVAPADEAQAADAPVSGGAEADVSTRLDALEAAVAQILEIVQGAANVEKTAMSAQTALEDSAPAVPAIKDSPLSDESVEVKLAKANSKLKGEAKERLMNIVAKASVQKNKFETKAIHANPKGLKTIASKFKAELETATEVETAEVAFSFSKAKERAAAGKKLGNK
jgi:hypothetical protein